MITVLTCASLNDPINGRIEYTSGTTALHDFGTVQVATYVCDSGYGLVGDNSRTCEGSTGAWSGSPATCVGKNSITNAQSICFLTLVLTSHVYNGSS